MKTDILSRINDSKEYLEELIYQLNGDYPDSKFILWQTYDGDWMIFTDDEYFHASDKAIDIWEEFNKKFPWELFSFMPFDSYCYTSYLRENEFTKI